MNRPEWEEMVRVRQLVGRYTEPWLAEGDGVWADGKFVGRFATDELAGLSARLHNIFLPATNAILQLSFKLEDARKVKSDLESEGR